MARIIALDYGKKRTGIATTDPLQIIVTGLDTVDTQVLWPFLEKYCSEEEVDKLVFGWPTHADGTPTALCEDIITLEKRFSKKFPNIILDRTDESFTSHQAKEAILLSGAKKKKRRDKALVDKISAVIILQKYLGHI